MTVTFCFTPEHLGIMPHHTSPPREPQEYAPIFARRCCSVMRARVSRRQNPFSPNRHEMRALILVLDSVGIGGAPDAAAYGDEGSDTVGHIAEACAAGRANKDREGPLRLPNLAAARHGRGLPARHRAYPSRPREAPALRGGATPARAKSRRARTPHRAIGRSPACRSTRLGLFPADAALLPARTHCSAVRAGEPAGILGHRHASGTQIIAELGEEHMRSGKPICYTSADSVFQIAAHEETFGLERLYASARSRAS